MKFEISKRQMELLIDMTDIETIWNIFGKDEVKMLMETKTLNFDNLEFDPNKIYILVVYVFNKIKMYKLTKTDPALIITDQTKFAFVNIDNSSESAYPIATVTQLFEWSKAEHDREIHEFNNFREFVSWHVVQ